MNLEEELRKNNESIRELTTSIKEYEAIIKELRKAIGDWKKKLEKANEDAERREIQAQLARERQLLTLAEQHFTGLERRLTGLRDSYNLLLRLQFEEKIQNSSVHSSLNGGFEDRCRQDLQKELWHLFQVGFADPKYYFQSSRKLVDKDALEIVKKHYSKNVSEEIDIFLYANPTLPWKLHKLEDTSPNLYPFTKKIVETPNWSPAIESLNQYPPYSCPITPPSSQNDLNKDVWEAQKNVRDVATMYMVFKATHSNKNLPFKLRQLEVQLAYVISRFHLRTHTKIPSENVAFKEFIAQEVLKLIAFAGVILVKGESKKLLNQAHGVMNDKGTPCPALAALYKNGRLCYFNGATYPSRLSLLEAKFESLGSIKEQKSPRHFENMEDFYGALCAKGLKDSQIAIIRKVFEEQEIEVFVLHSLTEKDLEKDGLKQGGLRKAILAVLGK
jgi:hypothetical protein